jgi:CBS-domain-containing membrane protein
MEQALERMAAHGVRRIPVVDDERCVSGIVTLVDLLKEHARQSAAERRDAAASERTALAAIARRSPGCEYHCTPRAVENGPDASGFVR